MGSDIKNIILGFRLDNGQAMSPYQRALVLKFANYVKTGETKSLMHYIHSNDIMVLLEFFSRHGSSILQDEFMDWLPS
jgi:hypothetical protein